MIHRDDAELYFGSCQAFAHPPYGSDREYRGEKGQDYSADLTLARLAAGAEDCGFCSILYQGIQLKRRFWILKWARFQWIDSQNGCNVPEAEIQQPWIKDYWDHIQCGKSINEKEVFLNIKFPRGHPYVDVHMMVAPSHLHQSSRRRALIDLEFYTAPGTFTCLF